MDEHNTRTMLWRPYELTMVRAAGVSPEVELALADPGLPDGCHHMFVRDAELMLQAQQQDPVAFGDEDCWWSRVLEEVELGALGPE
ncbi:hypothetical protein ACFV5G_36690 [Streptomyces sp. NPDC059766]|uniref:hypothetical protein n=1 Tax=Streptomyces sp. NPDC059766 TaxID=3346940 RepID=UPI00364D0A69